MNIRRRLKRYSLKKDRKTSCHSVNIDIIFDNIGKDGGSLDKQFDKIIDAVYDTEPIKRYYLECAIGCKEFDNGNKAHVEISAFPCRDYVNVNKHFDDFNEAVKAFVTNRERNGFNEAGFSILEEYSSKVVRWNLLKEGKEDEFITVRVLDDLKFENR